MLLAVSCGALARSKGDCGHLPGLMAPIDWIILIGYLAATLALGLWLARRNRGEDDYFVAGRSLSGWLADPLK